MTRSFWLPWEPERNPDGDQGHQSPFPRSFLAPAGAGAGRPGKKKRGGLQAAPRFCRPWAPTQATRVCTRRGVPAGSRRTSSHRRSGSVSRRTRASSWYLRPRNIEEPTLQVGNRTADARYVVAELTDTKVALTTKPAAEPPGYMAMIQYCGPFFAAEFACRSGRTDTLGEPTPLASIGVLASAACMHAVDSSWGPGGHSKVALSAMLTAPFAATFGCVRGRGPGLLFSESLATQEAQKVHQASAKTYQVVAQLTKARVAIRTQPSPDQLG
jgi:hypothetical protein